jgi:hypothetical protein
MRPLKLVQHMKTNGGLLVGLVQGRVFTLLTAVFTLLICQHHEGSTLHTERDLH